MSFLKAISLIALLLSLTPCYGAMVDPQIKWKTLETDHFKFIFDQDNLDIAQIFAKESEVVYQKLMTIFEIAPEKTTVIIQDVSDLANGFATFLPLPMITVFPVLPHPLDSIGDYENWVHDLMLHEYTHILSFEPSEGIFKPLRWTFGNLIHPTALLPSWWLEGLAVYTETMFSKNGRLRSNLTTAQLRALQLKDQKIEERIDRINESSIPSWPFGQRPYFYGSLLWNDWMSKSDTKLPQRLLDRYSKRIPFLLNSPLEEELNVSIIESFSNLKDKLSKYAQGEIDTLNNSESTSEVVLFNDKISYLPSLSHDQKKLLAVTSKPFEGTFIEIIECQSGSFKDISNCSNRKILKTKATRSISWHPTENKFIFDKIVRFNKFSERSDLFIHDLDSNKTTQITQGLRASEPNWSPDGKKVLYVKLLASNSKLMEYDLDSKTSNELFSSKSQQVRISSPTYLNQSKLAFLKKEISQENELWIIDLNEYDHSIRNIRKALDTQYKVKFLKYSNPNLLIGSEKNGTLNLYKFEIDSLKITPLTNSLTLVDGGELLENNSEMIISELTGNGRSLKVKTYNKIDSLKNLDNSIFNSNLKSEYFENAYPSTLETSSLINDEVHDFSSWPYLIPKYWIPFLYPIESGVLFQGSTSAGDPLGKHQYLLNGSIDTVTNQPSFGLSYLNGVTSVDWGISYSKIQEYYIVNDLEITQISKSIFASSNIYGLSDNWKWQTSANNLESSSNDTSYSRTGVSVGFQYSSSINTNFEDEELQKVDINPSNQQFYSFNQSYFNKSENLRSYYRSNLNTHFTFRSFLPIRHNLSFGLKGSYAPDLPDSSLGLLGERTIGGNYLASLISSEFLMRGYPSTNFIGKNIVNLNFDYSLPIWDIYKGKGLLPLFIKNINFNFFIDGISVDGKAYSSIEESYVNKKINDAFWATGFELKLNTTMGFYFPVSYILGAYYGLNEDYQGGFIPFFGIGIDGISDLNHRSSIARLSH